jgi:hypothetical protein
MKHRMAKTCKSISELREAVKEHYKNFMFED